MAGLPEGMDGPEADGFTHLWAQSSDGLRLHARLYGTLGGGTLPVVCLPGLSRHAADFDDLARLLAKPGSGRAVLAVDYRGRGLSDPASDPAHYAVPVETADLVALLGTVGIARAVFVGTSRGGLITMALAAASADARPDLVAGAVLNDIGPVLEIGGLLRLKSYVGKLGTPLSLDAAAEATRALFGAQFPNLDAAGWRHWAAATWTERNGALALSHDPLLARTLDAVAPDTVMPDLWPLFDALRGRPVLAVRGALSDLLSAETLAGMAARHPDLETLTIPDEGHTPFLHRGPALAAVRRLLARAEAEVPPATVPVSAPVG